MFGISFFDFFGTLNVGSFPPIVKLIIFIFLLSLIAPAINTLALTGKGVLICDTHKEVYVIQGTDRISDLSLSENALRFLGDTSATSSIFKSEQELIRNRIDRLRYLQETEESEIIVALPPSYKQIGVADAGDCVECDEIDDSACFDSQNITYENMRARDSSEFSLFGRLFKYRTVCSEGITEPNERINISYVQLGNETDYNDFWQGSMYAIETDFSVDELIHATSVTYSSLYKDDLRIFDDVFPIQCDFKNRPSLTVLGLPIFETEFWIFGLLIVFMFKGYYFIRRR